MTFGDDGLKPFFLIKSSFHILIILIQLQKIESGHLGFEVARSFYFSISKDYRVLRDRLKRDVHFISYDWNR